MVFGEVLSFLKMSCQSRDKGDDAVSAEIDIRLGLAGVFETMSTAMYETTHQPSFCVSIAISMGV